MGDDGAVWASAVKVDEVGCGVQGELRGFVELRGVSTDELNAKNFFGFTTFHEGEVLSSTVRRVMGDDHFTERGIGAEFSDQASERSI